MKISVITVSKNSAKTIARTAFSVLNQSYRLVEHVIKDAGSTDNTIELVKSINPNAMVIVKPDNGIYDAMNQGYLACTGDIVAFLNSDDFYVDGNVLADVISAFQVGDFDFAYGDITMVSSAGEVVRCWTVGEIGEFGLVGQQIPHPGLFVKRDVIAKLIMPFDPSYKIAGDLKQQLLIINKNKCKGQYIRRPLAIMETGGESTKSVNSYWMGWKESVRAYNEVLGGGGLLFVIQKVLSKFGGLRIGAQLRHFGK